MEKARETEAETLGKRRSIGSSGGVPLPGTTAAGMELARGGTAGPGGGGAVGGGLMSDERPGGGGRLEFSSNGQAAPGAEGEGRGPIYMELNTDSTTRATFYEYEYKWVCSVGVEHLAPTKIQQYSSSWNVAVLLCGRLGRFS